MHLEELRRSAVLCAMLSTFVVCAQSEAHIAYVPSTPLENTADDAAMGFRQGTIPGILELQLPAGTRQVDILNARGNVVHRFGEDHITNLDLADLSRGTWTLRAHTPHGFSIRRFVVMQLGSVAWAVPRSGKR